VLKSNPSKKSTEGKFLDRQTFRRNISPPFSVLKSNPRNQQKGSSEIDVSEKYIAFFFRVEE
jgi:vacuolar-type H+-ATPase subunit B/Vma2